LIEARLGLYRLQQKCSFTESSFRQYVIYGVIRIDYEERMR